jgi:WD40 repeat protein
VVKWHPSFESLLVAASDDFSVRVLDVRENKVISSLKYENHVESLDFNSNNHNEVVISYENGFISCLDARKPTSALWSFRASMKAVTSVSCS